MSIRTIYDILRFASAATGPAMITVLGLRLGGLLNHKDALIDLIILLVVGVFSPILAGWLRRRQ